jgi:plasmid stabilization system protein ParE
VSARLVVRSAAEADFADAALWYEARAEGLGADFLRAVDVALAEIGRQPDRSPRVHRECRKALLRRFPYAVYFVTGADLTSVIACMHVRRDPGTWQRRVSEGTAETLGEG